MHPYMSRHNVIPSHMVMCCIYSGSRTWQ